jgi:hypothetical protein
MSELSNEELTEKTRSLEKRLKRLAAPYEDALSDRIFASVQKSFRAWLAIWLGTFSIVLVLVGYFGFEDVIATAKRTIADQLAAQVTTQLQDEVKIEISKALEPVKQTLLESSLNDISKFDADLAQLLANMQSAIDQRIEEFATKLAPSIKDLDLPKTLTDKPKPAPLAGFAYYGRRSGRGWSERNFSVINGKPKDTYPETGDVVIAKVPVNARSGVIEFTLRGWVNKPTVGLIKPERKLEVKRVETVAGGSHVWIKFVTKD